MAWNCAIWHSNYIKNREDAEKLYNKLSEGDTSLIGPTQRIQDLYEELTYKHPEIDDVNEDEINNFDICPWSCAFDKSEGHIIMTCVDSEAEYVNIKIKELAKKYELSFYDPQNSIFIK